MTPNALSDDLSSPVGTRGKLSESLLPSVTDSGWSSGKQASVVSVLTCRAIALVIFHLNHTLWDFLCSTNFFSILLGAARTPVIIAVMTFPLIHLSSLLGWFFLTFHPLVLFRTSLLLITQICSKKCFLFSGLVHQLAAHDFGKSPLSYRPLL